MACSDRLQPGHGRRLAHDGLKPVPANEKTREPSAHGFDTASLRTAQLLLARGSLFVFVLMVMVVRQVARKLLAVGRGDVEMTVELFDVGGGKLVERRREDASL